MAFLWQYQMLWGSNCDQSTSVENRATLMTMSYGVGIKQCSVCKTGKLELVATYVNVVP